MPRILLSAAQQRGIVLFDEYRDPPCPGCNKAVDDFLADKPERPQRIERQNYQNYFFRKGIAGHALTAVQRISSPQWKTWLPAASARRNKSSFQRTRPPGLISARKFPVSRTA